MGLGLSQYIPFLVYVTSIVVVFMALSGRVAVGVYFVTLLVPLTSLYKKLYVYPLGTDLNDILLFSLFIGWYIHASGSGRQVADQTPLNKPLLFLILYAYFSLWVGYYYYNDSLPITVDNVRLFTWKNYASMFLLFWVAFNNIRTRQQVLLLLTVMAFSIVVVNFRFHSEFQWIRQFHYTERMRQVSSTFDFLGANHLGSFFSQYGVLFLGILLSMKNLSWRRVLFFIAFAWSMHSTLYTYSRGAYLGTLVAITVIFFIHDKRLLILPILLLSFWKSVAPVSVVERIEMTVSEEGEYDPSAQARIELWTEAVEMAKRNPVTGVGYDTFWHGDPHFQGLRDTHNYYLKILAEQGLIGLGAFIYLLYLSIRRCWLLYRSSSDVLFRGIGLGGMGCVLSLATSNFFGDRWSFFMMTGFYFVLLAIVERAHAHEAVYAESHG